MPFSPPPSTSAPACHRCGYSLAGLTELVCPECGAKFDPKAIPRRTRVRRWIVSGLVLFFVLYAPYSWLLWIDYPWSDYHWLWVQMWPGLPLLVPAHSFGRLIGVEVDEALGRAVLDVLGIALWLGLTALVRRRWWRLIAGAMAISLLSIWNSIMLYHAFLM